MIRMTSALSKTTHLVRIGLASAALGALAACGGTTATTAPSSGSAVTTSASKPSSAATSATASDADLTKQLMASMKAAKSFRMTVTPLPSSTSTIPASNITAEVVMRDNGKADLRMKMTLEGKEIESITVDGVNYIKNPAPTGKPWLKYASTSNGPGDDPSQIFSSFSAAKITKIGQEGELTKYQVVGATAQKGDVFVWTDSQGRPAKVQASGALTTFSDWGAAITIVAPPADQVQAK